MIARRSFLLGMLAAASGPAIVRASSLMPIKAPEIIVPRGIPILGQDGKPLSAAEWGAGVLGYCSMFWHYQVTYNELTGEILRVARIEP